MTTSHDLYEDYLNELESAVQDYVSTSPGADGESIRTYLAFVRSVEVLQGQNETPRSGMSQAQFTVVRLLYFAGEGRLVQTEIARAMGVTATYVTRIVDALERKGWVKRVTGVADRRLTFAELTPQGRENFERVVPGVIRRMQATVQDFTDDEKRTLQYLLSKLTLGISGTRGESEPGARVETAVRLEA
jgi:MarR family 2-MHQ and catechol resistance regulon transcriptional repressor